MKIEESTLDDPMLEELVKESQHKGKWFVGDEKLLFSLNKLFNEKVSYQMTLSH